MCSKCQNPEGTLNRPGIKDFEHAPAPQGLRLARPLFEQPVGFILRPLPVLLLYGSSAVTVMPQIFNSHSGM